MTDFNPVEVDINALADLIYRQKFAYPNSPEVRSLESLTPWERQFPTDRATQIAEWFKANILHDVWARAYQAGVEDERMSEANIGVAGCFCSSFPCRCKITPARTNPYSTFGDK